MASTCQPFVLSVRGARTSRISSAMAHLVQADGPQAAAALVEDHLAERAQLAGRALDALAGGEVEPAVVAVAAQALAGLIVRPVVGDGTGEVRAFLLEGEVLAALAADEDRRGAGVGIVEHL